MVRAPVAASRAPGVGDCVTCGRCCHHPPASVQLVAIDEKRMSKRTLDMYTEALARPPFSRFMQNDGERCAALDLSVSDRYPCAIYEQRPDACRIVEPGSPACLEARDLGHLGFGLSRDP